MHNQAAVLAGELLEGDVQGHPGGAGEAFEHGAEEAAAARGPEPHGALGQRELRVAEQGRRIGADLHAQPFAGPGTSPAGC